MPRVVLPNNVKEMTISAIVTRADGTVENIGVVSYTHKSWLKTTWWNLKHKWAKRFPRLS